MGRRTALPLSALLTLTALVTLLIIQTTLACTDKIALPVPGGAMAMMPGMDMSAMRDSAGGPVLMVCPVVLGLFGLSLALSAAALAMLWRDAHRSLVLRTIARALAGLPPLRAAAAVALTSAGSVAAMVRLDGMGPSGAAEYATVLALLVACSLSAVLFAVAGGRVALALSRRLIRAIAAAVGCASPPVPVRARRRAVGTGIAGEGALLSRGRGLRAPPAFVR